LVNFAHDRSNVFGASVAQIYFEDVQGTITTNKNCIYDEIQNAKLFSLFK